MTTIKIHENLLGQISYYFFNYPWRKLGECWKKETEPFINLGGYNRKEIINSGEKEYLNPYPNSSSKPM
jgi:hypothetical protein